MVPVPARSSRRRLLWRRMLRSSSLRPLRCRWSISGESDPWDMLEWEGLPTVREDSRIGGRQSRAVRRAAQSNGRWVDNRSYGAWRSYPGGVSPLEYGPAPSRRRDLPVRRRSVHWLDCRPPASGPNESIHRIDVRAHDRNSASGRPTSSIALRSARRVSLRAYRFGTRAAAWDLHWPRRPRHARPQSLTSLKGPLAPPTLPADDQQPALAQARGGLFVLQSQTVRSRADTCWSIRWTLRKKASCRLMSLRS